MRQRETFLILLREWVTFRRQHEWQQTITTLSTIWFSIRVYGATFDNFSYRESIAHEIRNRHLNLTRSEFVYCFAARWNVSKMYFHITLASFSSHTHTLVLSLFQAENKRATKWAQKSPKNAQLHSYTIYMHFIVIGNVSLFTLSDTFDCRLALSHSHTHTLSSCTFSVSPQSKSGDNERKWQESTESHAFSLYLMIVVLVLIRIAFRSNSTHKMQKEKENKKKKKKLMEKNDTEKRTKTSRNGIQKYSKIFV